MAVPFIDLQRFEPDFLDRWAEKCREITAQTRFVAGPEATRLEETLARDNGVAEAVGCANGTDALQLALRAVGVRWSDRVVIPDLTFWATFEAVVNCGAFPIAVDIDRDLQMDFDLFRRAVEEHRPQAAILVHLSGWGSARLDEFRAFCRARQLPLIEDGAQVYGVTWRDEPIFKKAHLATLSFYPAKVLGACGDAGAVLCSTAELAQRVRILGDHGRSAHYGHARVGWNSRLGGFEAAYLNLTLEYLPQRLASRRRMASLYRERLSELGFVCAAPPEGYVENGYLNVTLVHPERRPTIEKVLREARIGYATTYPKAISKQPGAQDWLPRDTGGERAEALTQSVLNLPLFAYLEEKELDEVLAAMDEARIRSA